MTDQEKKQQRVSLGIEIEDAQQEFAYLREKALRWAGNLDAIAKKVYRVATLNPSAADFTAEFELANRLTPECRPVLNFEEIEKLIEELRAARKQLFNLAERKSQLSNGDFSVTI